MLFNLHTHTHFSDGSSAPEAYAEEAIRQGFQTLGFSDHSPVPFENTFAIRDELMDEYIVDIQALNAKYSHSIHPSLPSGKVISEAKKDHSGQSRDGAGLTVLLGLEIDYIPGVTKPVEKYRQMNCFDYFIGSVHLVRNGNSRDLWFIDGPDINIYDEGLKTVFHGDIEAAVSAYYDQINGMIETEKPDIIGHLDKVRMYNRNRYFMEDEKWYRDLVDETLHLIKEHGNIVEVNTRGIYKKRSDALFPGTDILKKIHALNIPITISSDAHKPHELSLYFAETRRLLMEIGFKSVSLKIPQGWEEIPLI